MIIKYLRSNYFTYWNTRVHLEPKMRTYIEFKSKFIFEDYLSISNEDDRKALTRLRVSAHTLAIERGRYTTPPTPVEARTCSHCPDNQVENEMHFIMKCSKYMQQRETLFAEIARICEQFYKLNDKEKFIYLMSAGVDVSRHVGRFIRENLR